MSACFGEARHLTVVNVKRRAGCRAGSPGCADPPRSKSDATVVWCRRERALGAGIAPGVIILIVDSGRLAVGAIVDAAGCGALDLGLIRVGSTRLFVVRMPMSVSSNSVALGDSRARGALARVGLGGGSLARRRFCGADGVDRLEHDVAERLVPRLPHVARGAGAHDPAFEGVKGDAGFAQTALAIGTQAAFDVEGRLHTARRLVGHESLLIVIVPPGLVLYYVQARFADGVRHGCRCVLLACCDVARTRAPQDRTEEGPNAFGEKMPGEKACTLVGSGW